MASIKEIIKSLTHEQKEELQQYATSIKEIKKKMTQMLNTAKTTYKEESGGNMSSGLSLQKDE